MARRKRRVYRRARHKGMLHGLKLMFTSRARLKGMVMGIVVTPLLINYTDFGKNLATWIVATSEKLRGS